MEFLYLWVTKSSAWEPHFHENFFNDRYGFFWGFIGAVVIGVIFSVVFYFGCCNSKTTCRLAKRGYWIIAMGICAAVACLYANFVVIGTGDQALPFHVNFYQANNSYYLEKTEGAPEALITDLTRGLDTIKHSLDEPFGDVRLEYGITTAALAAISFFVVSIVVKRFTINGRTVPFKKTINYV